MYFKLNGDYYIFTHMRSYEIWLNYRIYHWKTVEHNYMNNNNNVFCLTARLFRSKCKTLRLLLNNIGKRTLIFIITKCKFSAYFKFQRSWNGHLKRRIFKQFWNFSFRQNYYNIRLIFLELATFSISNASLTC